MDKKDLNKLVSDLENSYKNEKSEWMKKQLKELIEYVKPRVNWYNSFKNNLSQWNDMDNSINQMNAIEQDISNNVSEFLTKLEKESVSLWERKKQIDDKNIIKNIDNKVYLNKLYNDNLKSYVVNTKNDLVKSKEKPAEDLKSPEQMADDMTKMKDIVPEQKIEVKTETKAEEFKPIQVGWDKGRSIRQTPEWKYVFKSAVDGKDRSFDTIDEAKKEISTWIITHKKKELQDKLPNIKTEEELWTQMTSTKQALVDRWFSEWEIKNILWY